MKTLTDKIVNRYESKEKKIEISNQFVISELEVDKFDKKKTITTDTFEKKEKKNEFETSKVIIHK